MPLRPCLSSVASAAAVDCAGGSGYHRQRAGSGMRGGRRLEAAIGAATQGKVVLKKQR